MERYRKTNPASTPIATGNLDAGVELSGGKKEMKPKVSIVRTGRFLRNHLISMLAVLDLVAGNLPAADNVAARAPWLHG
jgi:hypothetical protein